MKLLPRIGLAIALGLAPTLVHAQNPVKICIPVVDTSTGVQIKSCVDVDSGHPLPTTGSGGGGGTANGSYQPSGTTAQLAVTSTTSNVALPSNTGTVVVYNIGTKIAYVKFGTSGAITATTANDVIGPGSAVAYNVGSNTFVAGITGGTDTTTLQITGGTGGFNAIPGSPATVSGAVTSVDGGITTIGSIADSAWAGGAASGTSIAVLKSISNAITGNLYTPGTAGAPGSQVLTTQLPTSNLVWGVTAAMTGTTSTQVIALVASKRIYVTKISCSNSHASVGTFVNVQDGSGGTTLATLAAGINFGGETDSGGGVPLFATTSGNGLYVADVTTGANVICSASGFSGS